MTDLKPCPFCDGEGSIIEAKVIIENPKRWWPECSNCHVYLHGFYTYENAVIAWNKRANDE